MSNWKEYKLKDICLKITDGSHKSPKAQPSGFPMFSVKDMREYGFSYEDCKLISADDFAEMKSTGCVPEKDDILIAKDGSYLKQIFICRETKEEAILSSIAIFRPNQNIVDPKFLMYILKSPRIFNYIKKNCVSGSAIPRIVLKAFRDVVLAIPESIDEQQKIAGFLSDIDAKIECNQKLCGNLEAQTQALFKHWFIDFIPFKDGKFVESELGRIPEGWRVGTLTEVSNYLNGLAMQKYPPTSKEDAIPVLKIKELGQSQCDKNSDKCSRKIKPEYLINDGDVVFSWSGTLLVDIWCGGLCGLNQHLFKVTSKKYPKWFYYMWTKHHLTEFIRIAKDKAVTMGHIKRGDLEKALVVIPESSILDTMTETMNDIIDGIINTRIESKRLAALRDTLLPKLMSGQIKL